MGFELLMHFFPNIVIEVNEVFRFVEQNEAC